MNIVPEYDKKDALAILKKELKDEFSTMPVLVGKENREFAARPKIIEKRRDLTN